MAIRLWSFGERTVIFIAKAEVQRELRKNAPVVLSEEVESVGAEIVGIGAGLQRGLLRHAEKKIGEVVASVVDGLGTAGYERGSLKSSEDERPFGVFRGAKALQDAPIVAAESPIVFAAIPGKRVGNSVGLVEFAARRGIGKTPEGGETDAGEAEVERIGGHTFNSRETRDVGRIRVKVRGRYVIVVVVEAQNVGAAAVTVGPAGARVKPLRVGAALK